MHRDESELTARRAAVLVILAINNDGLMGKAPSYLSEKLYEVTMSIEPEGLLDHRNLRRLVEWMEKWRVCPERVEQLKAHVAECEAASDRLGF